MLTSALALLASGALAQEMAFNRVASFPVIANMAEGEDTARVSSAEIITVSGDGMTLVYSDSPLGVLGFVDITDPAAPVALGNMGMDGEPTSVTAQGGTVFAAVNTRASFTEPSGYLAAIDIATMAETGRCDLGGQPDSSAVAPDGSFVAVAIENERDEDAGDGRVPQMPAGWVSIVPLVDGVMDCDGIVRADVTGLAEIAPEDPEPEFVDISPAGEIAVTLQENNHIVVLDRAGAVTSHFSAGTVDLDGVDATDEQAAMRFTETLTGVLREPDALQWIDDTHFAIANEGDMDGGSRGWTIFSRTGEVIWDSGMSMEHAIAQIGHYPDRRSDAKGAEPEGMEFAVVNGMPMVFVLSERASVVAVYDVTDPAAPVLAQFLPSGVSPEGAVAIPERGLLATANEADLSEDGLARSHVMVFAMEEEAARYPYLTSEGADDLIGWAAMSGLVADPAQPGIFYAVNDSFFGYQPRIFTIDATQTPARIVGAVDVTRGGFPAQKIDMEGIALDGEGGFWVASEGRTDRMIPHGIYQVNGAGEIVREIPFPAELLAQEIRFGAEGITLVGDTLWIAIQREWGDDPANMVKLVAYNLETGEWGAVHYPKAAPEGDGWVGLSEIVAHGDWVYLIERDNQTGGNAAIKLVTRVPLAEMVPAPLGGPLPVVTREVVRDLIPDLATNGGYVLEKIEGMAVDADGVGWLITDNDGVDDSSGETMFWSIGQM
jgi:DNA-binding beta-propeller fold protein YncE